jgi:putative sigma-54 modulation protein
VAGRRPLWSKGTVQIKISTRHGHVSEATREKMSAKLEKLARLFERLSAIDVTVDLERAESPLVEVLVSAEHKHDFVATEQAEGLLAALDGAIHKIEQQLRKYKERVQDHHRGAGNRRQAAEPEAGGD